MIDDFDLDGDDSDVSEDINEGSEQKEDGHPPDEIVKEAEMEEPAKPVEVAVRPVEASSTEATNGIAAEGSEKVLANKWPANPYEEESDKGEEQEKQEIQNPEKPADATVEPEPEAVANKAAANGDQPSTSAKPAEKVTEPLTPTTATDTPALDRKPSTSSSSATANKRARTVSQEAEARAKKQRSIVPRDKLTAFSALAPMEMSFFGSTAADEFQREVGQWILAWGLNAKHLELEAKVGVLMDARIPRKLPQQRIKLPVAVETIINDSSLVRFESNMTANQHKAYNLMLNARTEVINTQNIQSEPVSYQHHYWTDKFYEIPGIGKTRVTTNKTGELVAAVRKTRIADMNIYSPKNKFDWRISLSSEVPIDIGKFDMMPLPLNMSRRKNRVSYARMGMQIDLTQVKTVDGDRGESLMHELEVEYVDPQSLVNFGASQAARAQRERDGFSDYDTQIERFINDIRLLCRNAAPP